MHKSSLNHRFFRLDFARPNRLCFVSEGGKSGIERVDECEKPKNQINLMVAKINDETLRNLIEHLEWMEKSQAKTDLLLQLLASLEIEQSDKFFNFFPEKKDLYAQKARSYQLNFSIIMELKKIVEEALDFLQKDELTKKNMDLENLLEKI